MGLLKVFVCFFLIALAFLTGNTRSMAQSDNDADLQAISNDQASDEKSREERTRMTLDEIHALEAKMDQNAKRLDALEEAIDNGTSAPVTVVEAAPVKQEEVVVQTTPAPIEVPFPPETPVQLTPSGASKEGFARPSIFYSPALSLNREHTFELGEEDYYSNFNERGDYKRKGAFYGLFGAYTYRPLYSELIPVNVYHVDVHGDYGLESVDIDGGGKIKDVNNYIVEPRVWFGKDLNFGSVSSLTPYLGFGYRWDFDQLKKQFDDEGDGGFNIQTQYFYIPVGAEWTVRPVEGWRFTLNGEYDVLVWDRVNSYYSNLGFGLENAENTSHRGYGIRGSIKIVKEGELVNFFVEPYIRYWNIRATNTVDVLDNGITIGSNQEAANKTTEIGARIGAEF